MSKEIRCRQKDNANSITLNDTFPGTQYYEWDGKMYVMWDPWMEDSFKTTCSVLWKRLIPTVLINMIQEFTHIKDQEINEMNLI